MKDAAATSTRETAAEAKKPRLIGTMPLESFLLGLGGEDADDRGDDADGGDQQREHHADVAEEDLAEDQRGDERDGVGLEEVGRHAGAVTDVVAHVVGDRRGVARVVLGDARLDLADQVGADVGGLGEDAAADTHEHGEQGAAEAEALEDDRRGLVEQQQRQGRTEQAEPDGDHPDDAAGAVGDAEGRQVAAAAGRRGDPDVAAGGQRHADEADRWRRRRRRSRKNTARPARVSQPPSATGRTSRSRNTITAKTPSVRNCRLR